LAILERGSSRRTLSACEERRKQERAGLWIRISCEGRLLSSGAEASGLDAIRSMLHGPDRSRQNRQASPKNRGEGA
jgi:hypothetical protein